MSSGAAPYGFAFDGQGRLFDTEAAASALSSYTLSSTGVPSVISASVANGQVAACWVALTPDGRYAFTIDAHNAAISVLRHRPQWQPDAAQWDRLRPGFHEHPAPRRVGVR